MLSPKSLQNKDIKGPILQKIELYSYSKYDILCYMSKIHTEDNFYTISGLERRAWIRCLKDMIEYLTWLGEESCAEELENVFEWYEWLLENPEMLETKE